MSQVLYLRVDDDVAEAIKAISDATSVIKAKVVNAIIADSLWLDEGNPHSSRRKLAQTIRAEGEAVLHAGRGR